MEETFPFVEMSWKGRKIQRRWEPVLRSINKANFYAEYEMIKRCHRKANTYHLSAWKFDEDINWATENGFVVLCIHRTQSHEGYDHKFYMQSTIEPNTTIYGVAALNYEDAKIFKDAHLLPNGTDHKLVGQLLGYPDCCIDWFLSKWLKISSEPMFLLAQNTEDSTLINENTVQISGHPYLNILLRAFGFRICSFYPHSMKCESAKDFCQHWFNIMKEYEPEATQQLLELLNEKMTWTMHHGIIEVHTSVFRGITNGVFLDKFQKIEWTGE